VLVNIRDNYNCFYKIDKIIIVIYIITIIIEQKQELGQFYTTKYSHILQNLHIPIKYTNLIEPFAGNGDLVRYIKEQEKTNNVIYNIECYDIDVKQPYIIHRDTLINPPNYNGKFIITNPPYHSRNKCSNKEIFDKYSVNDLYKAFIAEIISNENFCDGGIIIIPLNFFSSIRISDIQLRQKFLEKYTIIQLNIFEENVFDDTSYTVCSFQFEIKKTKNLIEFPITIYPSKINITTILNNENNYSIGGEIYNLPTRNTYNIIRLTSKNADKKNTNILVKCIDDNLRNQICLTIVPDEKVFIDNTPNLTARTYASIIIEPPLNIEKQKLLVEKFNRFLQNYRTKYNSLFLTNYRESKDIARKRISFSLVFLIVGYILENFDTI
jgi:hypothetical protein